MTFQHLSYSTIRGLLDNCAYQQALEKIVGMKQALHPKAAAGIAYHAAIEAHEKARRAARLGLPGENENGIPKIDMYVAAEEKLNALPVDWGDDDKHDVLENEVGAAIDHWYDTLIPEGQPGEGGSLRDRVMDWEPISVELRYRMYLPDQTFYPTVGSPDCVYLRRDIRLDRDDGRLTVVDHKSAGSLGRYPHDGRGLKDQAALYLLAAIKAPVLPGLGGRRPTFEYHIARTREGKNKNFQGVRVVQMEIDDVDIDYAKQRVAKAHEMIRTADFPKNPDSWLCAPEWCGFHKDAGGPCDPHGPHEYDLRAELAS